MPDILYAPNREQVVTSNAWAFLHWLRTARGIALADWAALQRFSVIQPAEFSSAMADFGQLPDRPLALARHRGPQEALVLRRLGGERLALSRDQLAALARPSEPAAGADAAALPGEIAAPLRRSWPPALLIRPLADLLLHADIRPDDRVLVIGAAAWPWLAALLEGATVILASPTASALLAIAGEEAASVLVAPAPLIAEAAFQRARRRPNLAGLRGVIATGGPLSPEGRARVYTWIRSDLMLLARSGDTLWGNPLEPVYARPEATPGFFTPRPSAHPPP
jgi:hypothetical protein